MLRRFADDEAPGGNETKLSGCINTARNKWRNTTFHDHHFHCEHLNGTCIFLLNIQTLKNTTKTCFCTLKDHTLHSMLHK